MVFFDGFTSGETVEENGSTAPVDGLKLFLKAHWMGLRKYRQIIQTEYLTGKNGSRQLMVLSFARRNQL